MIFRTKNTKSSTTTTHIYLLARLKRLTTSALLDGAVGIYRCRIFRYFHELIGLQLKKNITVRNTDESNQSRFYFFLKLVRVYFFLLINVHKTSRLRTQLCTCGEKRTSRPNVIKKFKTHRISKSEFQIQNLKLKSESQKSEFTKIRFHKTKFLRH